MSGLREKKKSERKLRIQNAAIDLFGSKGFSNTTMEAIAAKAELGVGTLYNYYSSKGDILLSIISDRTDDYASDFEAVINNYSNDIQTSINAFFDIYLKSFSTYSRVIWREFISNALSANNSLSRHIAVIDAIFLEYLGRLLSCMKSEGLIKENVDIEKSVSTLYSLVISHILRYISDETYELDTLRISFSDQTAVLVCGLSNK